MNHNFIPIPMGEYPKRGNCLSFALGITNYTYSYQLHLDSLLPIEKAFMSKYQEFYSDNLRQVQSEEDVLENEYLFKVFDFSDYHDPVLKITIKCNFHVCRRELNGIWVHKPGWQEAPCKIDNW